MEPFGPGVPAFRGEVKLAVECEMASKLIDFMDRRSVLLLFSPDFGLAGAVEAADDGFEPVGGDVRVPLCRVFIVLVRTDERCHVPSSE